MLFLFRFLGFRKLLALFVLRKAWRVLRSRQAQAR
jgi:hypothetical protein